ncbi:MAG: bifunctional helix-turn-helix domain-containing protein/methylated-DNA--[protein]-cysteine S-methyltransferase [Xanthomonadales bacterium]|nr:bifunctional helix-turn-helix domain-containing protein/methylated-DNA--[protein]-cysteine S-methyltransferase [Xanthomonadales bacterium]
MDTRLDLTAKVLRWLVAHRAEQPSLSRVAREFGISPYKLQKLFRSHAGVSPKQFIKVLNRDQAYEHLAKGRSVMDSAFETGLSGPGRLHDLLVTTDAVTPGQVKARGRGLQLHYGFGPSPFGTALVSWSDGGITFLGFEPPGSPGQALEGLQQQWRDAELVESPKGAGALIEKIFDFGQQGDLRVWLRGSPFQLKVWEALLRIPPGQQVSYGTISRMIEHPRAHRAVGAAIGRNPVSWLIPCHRVITSLGRTGGYRWGVATKVTMQALESARRDRAA